MNVSFSTIELNYANEFLKHQKYNYLNSVIKDYQKHYEKIMELV